MSSAARSRSPWASLSARTACPEVKPISVSATICALSAGPAASSSAAATSGAGGEGEALCGCGGGSGDGGSGGGGRGIENASGARSAPGPAAAAARAKRSSCARRKAAARAPRPGVSLLAATVASTAGCVACGAAVAVGGAASSPPPGALGSALNSLGLVVDLDATEYDAVFVVHYSVDGAPG